MAWFDNLVPIDFMNEASNKTAASEAHYLNQ
jgi:hypothetical protein